ncbi:MAG: hypothetical protein ABI300_04340 [Rhodanobacter sp.]
MSLASRIAEVRVAQLRVARARAELQHATDGLLAGSREHPLTTVAVAAGAGTVLGALKLPAIRVPGMAGLLASGAAEGVALGARLLAEMAAVDLVSSKVAGDAVDAAGAAQPPVVDPAGA